MIQPAWVRTGGGNSVRGNGRLSASEDRWMTNLGQAIPLGRVVYRGKDLFGDLASLSWMGLLLYGITGRVFDEKQVRLFDGIWALGTSYPEPRLWNNRVAALAGTARSTTSLGVAGATAISEAIIYGHRPQMAAADFLFRAGAYLDHGGEIDCFIDGELEKARTPDRGRPGSGKNRAVAATPGYGRPLAALEDERIKPVMKLAADLGFAEGRLVKLAFAMESALVRRRPEWRMNIAAVKAALALDQGITPRQYYHYVTPSFIGGFIPCAIDAFDHEEGTFFPLSCERINYLGHAHRIWGKENIPPTISDRVHDNPSRTTAY